MRVISKAQIKRFWEQVGCDDAEGPLRAWHTHVSSKAVSWNSWADVKASHGSASTVGNCVVFNVGGNKYRLVTRILYSSHKVFVLRVMTHEEYDDPNWKKECGFYKQPPPKPEQPKPGTIRNLKRKRR